MINLMIKNKMTSQKKTKMLLSCLRSLEVTSNQMKIAKHFFKILVMKFNAKYNISFQLVRSGKCVSQTKPRPLIIMHLFEIERQINYFDTCLALIAV